jgi:hypothetical protein
MVPAPRFSTSHFWIYRKTRDPTASIAGSLSSFKTKQGHRTVSPQRLVPFDIPFPSLLRFIHTLLVSLHGFPPTPSSSVPGSTDPTPNSHVTEPNRLGHHHSCRRRRLLPVRCRRGPHWRRPSGRRPPSIGSTSRPPPPRGALTTAAPPRSTRSR